MKKVLLTLAIIFIGLLAATAQSSTTLKISLYPVQIIEFDSTIENDNLETLYDGNLSTFSTSGFNVNVISTDEDEYNHNIEFNSANPENPDMITKEASKVDNHHTIADQALINNSDRVNSDSLVNRIALNVTPDLIYSIEAL